MLTAQTPGSQSLWHKAAAWLLLAAWFFMVAAASFAGTMGKWALRDPSKRTSVQYFLDKTVERPFVYRQLIPALARSLEVLTPEAIKSIAVAKLRPDKTFSLATGPTKPNLRFSYVVVFYLTFASLLGALGFLFAFLRDARFNTVAAAVAPAALALALPYLQTLGGYFYDASELFFLAASAWACQRGRSLVFLMLAALGTLNKETYFFFIPALYPLLPVGDGRRKALLWLGAGLIVSGLLNIAVRLEFPAASGGTAAEFHLLTNLVLYTSVATYFQAEVTYGLVGPSGASLATLLIALATARLGWHGLPQKIRRHGAWALAINTPLFLVFGAAGELRNLSFCFVALAALFASIVQTATQNDSAGSGHTNA